MSAPNTNPTARPPKPPALTSVPSTPGPEVPGGYPRNSVVFATNKWDRPSSKGKSGLLAATKAYLPPAVTSYFPSSSPSTSAPVVDLDSPGRPSSVGHTPGVALHSDSSATSALSTRAWADSDSSRATLTPNPSDFPTPGGRTFASRSNSNSNAKSDSSGTVERDYFGPVVLADVDEHPTADRDSSAPAVDADTAVAITEADEQEGPHGTQLVDSIVVPPPNPTESHANATPAPAVDSPASASSGAGSGFSTTSESTTSTAPSFTLSVSSPQSLKPRPSVTYSPSTAGARPTVTKAGSTLARSPASGDASGSTSGSGRRLSGAVKRFASLRRRDKPAPPSAVGGHSRGASLDSPASPPASSSGSLTATSESTEVASSRASKNSRRTSLMRTLRGEAAMLAGRVRGDPERVERGKRIMAGDI